MKKLIISFFLLILINQVNAFTGGECFNNGTETICPNVKIQYDITSGSYIDGRCFNNGTETLCPNVTIFSSITNYPRQFGTEGNVSFFFSVYGRPLSKLFEYDRTGGSGTVESLEYYKLNFFLISMIMLGLILFVIFDIEKVKRLNINRGKP